MSRRIPETASLARLAKRAERIRGFSDAAWDEQPNGVLRVAQTSPQFGLCGFRAELVALAESEGYEITEAGKMVHVYRCNEWTKVPQFLVFTPKDVAL